MNDLTFLPAYQLAQGIRERTFSSVEVLEALLEKIAKHNDKLNAIATLDEERARKRATEADEAIAKGENWGALHGVPITIKDTLETLELRTTAGYKPLKDYIPQQDAIAVARLRAAGAIIFAKTNSPPLAADYQSNSPLFGRANNPWNLDYTPGGSTGGGAAAVAAGFSPLELGSDIGGSIRQPAHCCGIFGIKPTDRLVPTKGNLPELPGYPKSVRHILTVGTLARCVEDLELSLSIIAGADERQPEIPPVTLDHPPERLLSSLRIAWTSELGNLPVSQEISSALEQLVNKLLERGCQVEQQVPTKFNFDAAWENYGIVVGSEMLAAQPAFSGDNLLFAIKAIYHKTQVDRQFRDSPIERGLLKGFPNFRNYVQALDRRDRLIAQMDRFLNQWDVYLCPVSTVPAFTHCPQGKPIEVDGVKLPYTTACGAYTILFNFTGHPVVVLPIGQSKTGLPIGVQLVGKRWKDLELLAIAREINQVVGEFKHPDGY